LAGAITTKEDLLKVAILGFPQAGQQQLFSVLTGISLENLQQKPLDVWQGVCQVRDPRLDKLTEMYNPKKTTCTRIEYLLLPDFNLQGPAKASLFGQLRNAEELCFISRLQNAAGEVKNFMAELVIADLILVEKRLEAIEKDKYKKAADQKDKEKALMEMCKKHLEAEKKLSNLTVDAEQLKTLRAYQFLSLKPLVLVVNVPEDRVVDQSLSQEMNAAFGVPTVLLCAELEAEISQLESAEQAGFLQEMGIDEPAVSKMTRMAFRGLGLITFFTVGEDEVRSWPVKCGAAAPEAGGVIHSDIAKGFVRAELMKYADLISAGSEAKLKEQGRFFLKGKDYIVEDGDILHFRFNV
jgi:ribosome-binding ATPase YchF (GTP1/OBG family)